jgi:hypothetical protein
MADAMRLRDAATDWTGHRMDERLQLCAATLSIHGYLQGAHAERIMDRIYVDARRQGPSERRA